MHFNFYMVLSTRYEKAYNAMLQAWAVSKSDRENKDARTIYLACMRRVERLKQAIHLHCF